MHAPHSETNFSSPKQQLQLLLLSFPAQRRGYVYLLASIGGGVGLGLALYGGPFWAWQRVAGSGHGGGGGGAT